MDEKNLLAEKFEANRGHLRAVAYRMLGTLTEAEDAVQEAWLRLSRSDADSCRAEFSANRSPPPSISVINRPYLSYR